MKKITFEFIALELLEKIFRLENFILKNSFEQGNNSNSAIILIFDKAKQQILTNLETIINDIKIMDESFNASEVFSIQRSLSNCFISLTNLHKELNFLHTNWLKLETYTFIEQVIDNHFKEKKSAVNIILSDEYTFLETNLSTKFEGITDIFYNKSNGYREKSPTVILPKIEYSNPLNWSILIHELGHVDTDNIQKLLADDKMYPENISQGDKEKLKKWAEELYCDVFACSIVGPAYFMSLSCFALLQCLVTGYGKSSNSHPPFAMRFAMLNRYLDKHNLKIETELPSKTGLIHQFISEMYSVLNKNIRNIHYTPKETDIDGLMVFDSYLHDNLTIPCIINAEELSCINFLVKRLEEKIPIGSYRNNTNDSNKISKLTTTHTEEHDGIKTTKVESIKITKEDFDEIKKNLTERKTELWEILNAGWVYKIKVSFPFGQKLFFYDDNSVTINEKLKKFGEHLELLDDRLLASIEISRLIELIEK